MSAFLWLLPKGIAWPREIDSVLVRFCKGLTDYYGYVDSRIAKFLVQESDPRKTTDSTTPEGERDGLLPEWERAWGLPDPCLQEPLTVPERQRVLVQRIIMLGAQSRQWFAEVAAWTGHHIDPVSEIREYAPYMTGISRCGITLDDSGYFRWEIAQPEIRFYWKVSIDSAKLTWFRASAGQVGVDPHLKIGLATDLECVIRRWKPAHTEIIFDYSQLSQPFGGDPMAGTP